MIEKTRSEKLRDVFKSVPEDIRTIAENLIDDAVYWEIEIKKLRQYPQFIVHPKNPNLAKPSPISRQLERTQVQYTQIVKTLVMIYARSGGEDEEDLLDQMLNEYKNKRG